MARLKGFLCLAPQTRSDSSSLCLPETAISIKTQNRVNDDASLPVLSHLVPVTSGKGLVYVCFTVITAFKPRKNSSPDEFMSGKGRDASWEVSGSHYEVLPLHTCDIRKQSF